MDHRYIESALHYRKVPSLQDLCLYAACRHSDFSVSPRDVIDRAGAQSGAFARKGRLLSVGVETVVSCTLNLVIEVSGREMEPLPPGEPLQGYEEFGIDSGSAFGSADFDLFAHASVASPFERRFDLHVQGPLVPEREGFAKILRRAVDCLPVMKACVSDTDDSTRAPQLRWNLRTAYRVFEPPSWNVSSYNGLRAFEDVEAWSVEEMAKRLHLMTEGDRLQMRYLASNCYEKWQ